MARNSQKGHTSLKSLFAAMQLELDQAVQNPNGQVAKTVIDEGKRQVQETVYSPYTPVLYDRTGQLMEEWVVEKVSNGIAVFNDRRDGNTYVAEVVETGKGYSIEGWQYFDVPRPFTQNTIDELARSGKHVQALQDELIRRGHRVIRG